MADLNRVTQSLVEKEEEEEEFVMATKLLKSNKSACLHFVQSAALKKKKNLPWQLSE